MVGQRLLLAGFCCKIKKTGSDPAKNFVKNKIPD
jgi:hypothetical protein